MEELLEDLLLTLEKLDIVEKENVNRTVPRFELVHSFPANAINKLVEELLG